ncbi:MAG TPA: hypothetical protein VGC79_31320 [Polyangiaceae bacterium]
MKIRRMHAAFAAGACFVGLAAYGVGCSVPDRTFYDDTAGSGASSGSEASGGSAGRTTAGAPGNAGANDGGTVGEGGEAQGGEAGSTETAGGGNVRPTPSKGLIVIGGTDIDQAHGLISVIAPATGKELARETLPLTAQVAGIAYDGADQKDVWYLFVGADFPAKPDKVVDLQVRYFNDITDKWITLSKLTTLPPPVPGTLTVLNDRVAYLSHVVSGSTTVAALTILDTTDVRAVKTIAAAYTPQTPFSGNMVTLIGTRGTAADATGVGGTLDLGLQQACNASKVCQLFVQPIPVGDTIGSALGHVLGSYQGTPVAYASQLEQLDFFALSPATGNVKVYRATPNAPESADSFDAPQSANDLSGMAVAECQKTALVTANSENALYGVTLSAGAGVNFDLGRAGQLVAYEPFTRSVIATYNPTSDDFKTAPEDAGVAGPEITAVDVTSTGGATLKMVERTKLWEPPTDLRANVLVTRFPVPFTCAP